MSSLPRCDVVIVGAGITGLVAAEALTRDEAAVLVFEARDRVGGRVYGIPAGTGAVDLGATWSWPDDQLTLSLTERLGVPTFSQHLLGDALFEADHLGPRRLDGNPVDVPSFRFAGGTHSLAERLAHRLPRGTIRLRDSVSAITVEQDGARVDARTSSLRADQVIVAVPPALALEQITFTPELPPRVRAAAEATAVWMGATVKAVAVYEHAFWRTERLSGSAISYAGPFREFHDHSGPDARPPAIFAFAPSEHFAGAPPAAMERAFVAQLERLFGAEASDPRRTHVVDWSRETYTAPRRPSASASTAAFGAPMLRGPLHGRIHLASTETASAYAGHIEGAVQAGLETAGQVRDLRTATA